MRLTGRILRVEEVEEELERDDSFIWVKRKPTLDIEFEVESYVDEETGLVGERCQIITIGDKEMGDEADALKEEATAKEMTGIGETRTDTVLPSDKELKTAEKSMLNGDRDIEEHGYLEVLRTWKDGKLVTEEADNEPIKVRRFMQPVARVRMGASMTLNMGDYESCKIEISVEVPGYIEEIDEACAAVKAFIDMRLNKEVDDIREFRKRKEAGDKTTGEKG